MTQLVAIGDAHFGPQGGRNADRYRAFDQIVAAGLALDGLGAWLLLGDLFHARCTIDDRNALADRFRQMADRAPIVAIYGNHCMPGDLDIFGRLKAGYPISIVARPAVLSLRLATTQMAAIACLPYPQRGGLISAGTTRSTTLEAGREALGAIVLGLAADLGEAKARGLLTFTVAHLNVGGAISSVGQPQVGQEIEADPLMIQQLREHGPVLLGHIHRPQEIHGAYYAGSITAQDFGELEPKRFLIAEYEQTASRWTHRVTSRPLDTPRLYHVDGDLTREGFSWRVTAGPGGEVQPAPASWIGCEVRARYRYRASERSVLTDALVQAEFAQAAHLVLDPIAISDRALRAPQVAAARTLAEKVQAWAEQSGHVVSPSLLAKLAVLEQSDPTAVLTSVAQIDVDAPEPVVEEVPQ